MPRLANTGDIDRPIYGSSAQLNYNIKNIKIAIKITNYYNFLQCEMSSAFDLLGKVKLIINSEAFYVKLCHLKKAKKSRLPYMDRATWDG